MILFPSGTTPPLSRVSRCPWKAAQYMWSGEAMVRRCHTFKNQILNILTLKSIYKTFFAGLPCSKILLSINEVSFTVKFIGIFLPTGSIVDAWCTWHSHYWPPTTAGGTHSNFCCFFQLLPQYDFLKGPCFSMCITMIPQGPMLFNSCLTFKSSRASAPAPSPWLVGILRAMATPDRRPETLTTSSSEQIFLVWV